MAFAPEDKRVWRESEIMAEFERIAAETDLLGGPPAEAFQPILEKAAAQPAWEDEDSREPSAASGKRAELESLGARLMDEIGKMAQHLASAGRIKAAYRLERALAALKDITGGK